MRRGLVPTTPTASAAQPAASDCTRERPTLEKRLVGAVVLLVLGGFSLLGALADLGENLDSNGLAYVLGQLIVPIILIGGGLLLLRRE